MKEKEVILSGGKKVNVRELLFKETYTPATQEKIDKHGYAPAMIQLSTGLSDEEIECLSKKDGTKLWKVYQEINEEDFENFQKPQSQEGK